MSDAFHQSMVQQVSDPNNYYGSYLGQGDDPSWMRAQANMGAAMAQALSPNGNTYLENVTYNIYHHRALLKSIPTPAGPLCCKRMEGVNADALKQIIARYKRCTYAPEFDMDPLYGHGLVRSECHSGASELCCVLGVMEMCLSYTGQSNPNEY